MQQCKLITCIVPDDGTDLEVLGALRKDKQVLRATSLTARGMAVLEDAETRPGELPQPRLVRIIRIVVEAERADELFEYVFDVAGIGKPGGGTVFMGGDITASGYSLPDLPDEE